MQTKEITTPSLLLFSYELIKAGKEGWEMDERDSAYQMGFGQYHVGLIKVEEHRAAVLEVFPAKDTFTAKGEVAIPAVFPAVQPKSTLSLPHRKPGRPAKNDNAVMVAQQF